MFYWEQERIFFAHSRSKSGFLVSVCDKARQGILDVRGFGTVDPWKVHLLAMATPKRELIELLPENIWIESHGEHPIPFHVDVTIDTQIGVNVITVGVPL